MAFKGNLSVCGACVRRARESLDRGSSSFCPFIFFGCFLFPPFSATAAVRVPKVPSSAPGAPPDVPDQMKGPRGGCACLSLEQAPGRPPRGGQLSQKRRTVPSLWPVPSPELQLPIRSTECKLFPQSKLWGSGFRIQQPKPRFFSKSRGAPPPPLPYGMFLTHVRSPKQGQEHIPPHPWMLLGP